MSIIQRISGGGPARRAFQPRVFFVLLLAAAALCGCVRYDMTLTNGERITNVRKPEYNPKGGYWTYTSPSGKKYTISASRVVNVVPHGDTNGMFNSP